MGRTTHCLTILIAAWPALSWALAKEQSEADSNVRFDPLATLVSALSKIGDPFFLVCRDDDEPRQYCDRFSLALTRAKLINDNVAPPIFSNDPGDNWTGIKLYSPTISDAKDPKKDPFAKAFTDANISLYGICYGQPATCQSICPGGVILSLNLKSSHSNGVAPDPELNLPMRTIYIGQKPLPD
jgi:hypothetical protein